MIYEKWLQGDRYLGGQGEGEEGGGNDHLPLIEKLEELVSE